MMATREIEARSEALLAANLSGLSVAAAEGLRPDQHMRVSEWAEAHRIVSEDSAVPGPWRNDTAPYLTEPMDRLSPDDPIPEVAIIKSAQSGGSALAENWLGYIMHKAAGPAMYIQATIQAAMDWKEEKLSATIEASDVLNPDKGGVVLPVKDRSGKGSTSKRLRFRGGFLLFGGANSAASLRQHSIRYMVRDDTSAWTDNADKEGNPDWLSEQRLKTFKKFGLSKSLDVSTPTIKGENIDAKYERSDKRRYYMACKCCGMLNDWDWSDVQRQKSPPYRAHVVCSSCKTEHYEADKRAFMAAENGARWVPTIADENGEVPLSCISVEEAERWRNRALGVTRAGYHITGFMAAFEMWDELARLEDEAGDDPEKLKPFQNTSLGHAYEAKGDAPPWETLAARREADWQRGQAPAEVLYVTLTADIQQTGIYWERVGWGPNKRSWAIDHGFLPGDTSVANDGAWPKLDQVADQGCRHASGAVLHDDLIGVDCGYHSDAVYAWTRRRANALNLKGVDGWSRLPIDRAQNAEVKKTGLSAGKAKKYGARVWLVGGWGIKSTLMTLLSRLPKEGGSDWPLGYCHFPANAEDDYFRHLVSEYVAVEKTKRGPTRMWKPRGPNHWLDCRVYAWALTHFAGLWAWGDEQWQERADYINGLVQTGRDLFGPEAPSTVTPAVVRHAREDGDETPSTEDKPAERPARKVEDRFGLDALARLNNR
jgi:phage terminase large subunit GpA-like protein